jgi:hypothetical protein
LYSAAVSVFVALSFTLSVPMNMVRGISEPQKPGTIEREGRSDSAPQDSPQRAEIRASPSDNARLTDGTPVHLRFVRAVVSSRVIAGEKVTLEVVDPVLVGDLVAISPRAFAEATVTVAQANRSVGGGGSLELKIESVRLADGELVSLRAVKDVKGESNNRGVLATLGTAGLLSGSPLVYLFYVKGKSATIPAGAEITAYIAEEFHLDPSKFHVVDASSQGKSAPK